MNLLKLYIESLPIEVPMQFGVTGNVILNHLDIKDRLTRKGDISPKNFFMEFIHLDDDGEPTAREEFSFFKLNSERMDFIEMNFNDQFNKLLTLAGVMYNNDTVKLEAKMTEINDAMFDDEDGLLILADNLFAYNSKTRGKQKKKTAKVLKVEVETLNKKMNEFFYAVLQELVGIETSPRMFILSTVDKNGYKQLPDEFDFVSLEDNLVLDEKYLIRKAASEKPEVEDEVGDDVGDEVTDDIIDDIEDDNYGDIGDIDSIEESDEDYEEIN